MPVCFFDDFFIFSSTSSNSGYHEEYERERAPDYASDIVTDEAEAEEDDGDDQELVGADQEEEISKIFNEVEDEGHIEGQGTATAVIIDEIIFEDAVGCPHNIPSSALEHLDSDNDDIHEATRAATA